MYGNNDFTKKKDPLVDAVAKVMQENQIRRNVEKQVQEEMGIQAKRQLPFQKHAEYDRVLAERTAQALNEGTMKKEELVGNQHKIDANKNNKIDGQDFKILKAKKGQMEEENESAEKKMEKGEESKEASSMEEEKIDEKKKAYEPDAATKARNPLVYGDKKKSNPLVYGDKHRDNPLVYGKKKVTKEEAEQVDEVLDSPIKKMAYVMKAKKSIEKSDPKKTKQANDIANRVIGIKRVMKKLTKEETIEEKAPPGAKYERMVKHIKDKYSKGGLSDKEKSIAYATAWKAKGKESK